MDDVVITDGTWKKVSESRAAFRIYTPSNSSPNKILRERGLARRQENCRKHHRVRLAMKIDVEDSGKVNDGVDDEVSAKQSPFRLLSSRDLTAFGRSRET